MQNKGTKKRKLPGQYTIDERFNVYKIRDKASGKMVDSSSVPNLIKMLTLTERTRTKSSDHTHNDTDQMKVSLLRTRTQFQSTPAGRQNLDVHKHDDLLCNSASHSDHSNSMELDPEIEMGSIRSHEHKEGMDLSKLN